MARVLSLPFKIAPSGEALTVDQGDDEYYKQQLLTLLMTLQGERPINDTLGMPDQTFDGFQYSSFQSQVEDTLPEVINLDAQVEPISDTTESVIITFDVAPEQT